ncbi:MAG: hypothetical protein ACOYD9_00635 [Pyramidobacter sp.]
MMPVTIVQSTMGTTILSNWLVQKAEDPMMCFYKINSSYATRDAYLSSRRGVYFTSAMKNFERVLLDPDRLEK